MCDEMYAESPAMLAPMAPALGGATSFAEADAWEATTDEQDYVAETWYYWQSIVDNIHSNPDLTSQQRATLIQSATDDAAKRIAAYTPGTKERSGFLAKLFGKKATTDSGKPMKTEGGTQYPAEDYADVPDPESPSTWKLRMTDKPGNFTVPMIGNTITALQPGGYRGNEVQLGTSKSAVKKRIMAGISKSGADKDQKAGLIERLNAATKMSGKYTHPKPEPVAAINVSSFRTIKAADGTPRWIAVYTNNFEDDEGETFSEKSHHRFLAKLDAGEVEMPELRLWHLPGTKIGDADCIDYHDGFMVATGTYTIPQESIDSLAKMGDIALSHGYEFDREAFDGKTYDSYVTTEISLLPRIAAANKLTGFDINAAEEILTMTPAKKSFVASVLGDAKATELETTLSQLAGKAKEAGISYKEVDEMLATMAAPNASTTAPTGDNTAIIDAVKELLTPISDGLKAVTARLDVTDEAVRRIAGVKASDIDDKVAALLQPRSAVAVARKSVDGEPDPPEDGDDDEGDDGDETDESDPLVKAMMAAQAKGRTKLPPHLAHYADWGMDKLVTMNANGTHAN